MQEEVENKSVALSIKTTKFNVDTLLRIDEEQQEKKQEQHR